MANNSQDKPDWQEKAKDWKTVWKQVEYELGLYRKQIGYCKDCIHWCAHGPDKSDKLGMCLRQLRGYADTYGCILWECQDLSQCDEDAPESTNDSSKW